MFFAVVLIGSAPPPKVDEQRPTEAEGRREPTEHGVLHGKCWFYKIQICGTG